jgi:hypothetical protein
VAQYVDSTTAEPVADAAPEVQDRPWARPLVEVSGTFLGYLALTWLFLPALRDRSQAIYQDVLVHALGPDRTGAAAYVRQWSFPAWTRDTYGGGPYAAQIQHAIYYPGNLPYVLLHTSTAFDVVAASALTWAALGAFAFCRWALRTSYLASVLGGLAFGFGGMALQHVTLINQLQVLSWMPWVLLFAHLALETRRWRHVVLLAICIGMGLLAGHPEEWVYTLGALVLYGLCWSFAEVRQGLRVTALRLAEAGLRVGVAVALFVGLFGFQLLPTLRLMGLGYRNGTSFHDQYPMPTSSAVNSLLPDYGHILYGENVAFVGVVALALAGLGFAATRRSPLWFRVWCGLLAAGGFLMAVGLANPVYSIAYHHLPLVKAFRVPSRYLLLTSFTLSVLAALGMDALLEDHRDAVRQRLRQGALAAAALIAMFGFAFLIGGLQTNGTGVSIAKWAAAAGVGLFAWALMCWHRAPALPVALVLIAVVGLELHAARPYAEYRQRAPDIVYDDAGPVIKALAAGGGRYVTIAGDPTSAQQKQSLGTYGFTGHKLDYFLAGWPTRIAAGPNAQQFLRAQTILGRDGGMLPLQTYRDFFLNAVAQGDINGGRFGGPPSTWNWAGLDLLAVEWFVTPGLPLDEAAVLERHGFSIVQREAYVLVWHRTAPPLARLLYDVDVVPDSGERVRRLPTYPLLERVLADRPIPGLGRPTTPPSVREVKVANERVVLEATSSVPGLLVLADPAYPGWQATVNGKKQEIRTVDQAFRGVVVPAGTSRVVFTFHDRPRSIGLVLLPLTCLGIAGAFRVRRRRLRG